jgi:hypothetical protein
MKKSTQSNIEPLESRIAPAVFIVTTTADLGPGSFRQALLDADNHTGADTIIFHLPAPPLHSENQITLATGLTSKGDVTIVGPGAGKLIINGDGNRDLLITDGSATTNSPSTISGISFTDGGATGTGPGGSGGGIFSYESLTLKSVVVTNNTAAQGGGVAVGHDTAAHIKVNISNSLITSNFATKVGGGLSLYDLDSLSITKTTGSGNRTTGTNGGGGAYVEMNSTGTGFTLAGDNISGNSSDHGGGLFINSYSTNPKVKITLSGTISSGNTATGASGSLGGGGLYIQNGNVVISGGAFAGNTSANDGGGIAAQTATVSISKTLITGNTAASFGGGLDLYEMHSVNITGAAVTGNQTTSASNGGGGGYLGLGSTGTAIAVTGSLFAGNTANHGGGLLVSAYSAGSSGKITITGTKITGNVSTGTSFVGGGGLYVKFGVAGVIGSTISNNISAGDNGGGVEANNFTNLFISKSIITGNQTQKTNGGVSNGGGGLYIRGNGTTSVEATIAGSIVNGNKSTGNGGGLSATGGVDLGISKSVVSGNSAGGNGGGINTYGETTFLVDLTLSGSTVSGNSSTGGTTAYGGGIDANSSGVVVMSKSNVLGNTSIRYDGGILIKGSGSATLTNCVISGNTGHLDAGGLEFLNVPAFTVTGGSITGNSGNVGGGIFNSNSTGSIMGVLITHNSAAIAGGGVDNLSGAVTLQIATVIANTAVVDPDVHGTFTFV